MATTKDTQITTGEGENNYNRFRKFFHDNTDDDYGSQILTLIFATIVWTVCIIYLYFLLIGKRDSVYLEETDRMYLYVFTVIAAYPYLQFFSRYLRLRAGERDQARYTGQSNMTPHCTQSILELDENMQKAGIIGTIDFQCKEKVAKSMMESYNNLAMKSYYQATALLMIIIYLITQGKNANILSEDNPFLRAAVKISLIAGTTVMVMTGFAIGGHDSAITISIPSSAYVIQGASVFMIIAFILNRSLSLK